MVGSELIHSQVVRSPKELADVQGTLEDRNEGLNVALRSSGLHPLRVPCSC
jgi:hypothetical protein